MTGNAATPQPPSPFNAKDVHSTESKSDKGARWSVAAQLSWVMAMAIVIGLMIAGAVSELHRAPERDVASWLHVTDADIARETVHTQLFVAFVIVTGVAATVLLAVQRRFDRVAVAFFMVVAETVFAWFLYPSFALGSRDGTPAPPSPDIHAPMTPIPVPTDFDYHAHLPVIWDSVTTPALWSLAAAVPLGLLLAAAGQAWNRLRHNQSPQTRVETN